MLDRRIVFFLVSFSFLIACQDSASEQSLSPYDTCGNDVLDAPEICDGRALDGKTCGDFGYPEGQLRCNSKCTGFWVGSCSGIPSWREKPPCADCADDEICQDDQCVPVPTGSADPGGMQTFDIQTATIRGVVSWPRNRDGSEAERTETLYFSNTELDHDTSVTVGPNREYSVELHTGYSYRVSLRYSNEIEDSAIWSEWGDADSWINMALTSSPIRVTEDRVLNFDVPLSRPVEVRGTFTIDGPALPARGMLKFERIEETTATATQERSRQFAVRVPISTSDTPEFSTHLPKGEYQVEFLAGLSENFERSELDDYRFPETLSIDGPTGVDFVVPTATLRGRVVAPSGFRFEDGIVYHQTASGRYRFNNNSGRFEVSVPHGDYSVSARLETHGDGDWLTHTDAEVEVDGDVEIELRSEAVVVDVRGSISGISALELTRAPSLSFWNRAADGRSVYVELSPYRDSFRVVMPPGEYSPRLYLPVESAQGDSQFITLDDVSLTEDTELDIELPAFEPQPQPHPRVTVSGELTLLGRPIPEITEQPDDESWEYVRGHINFIPLDPTDPEPMRQVSIPATGPAAYEIDLLEGVPYRVELEVKPFRRGGGRMGPLTVRYVSPLIHGTYVLQPELKPSEDHRRDFDIKTVRRSAVFTAHGQMLPVDDDCRRGVVHTGGEARIVELPAFGGAEYSDDFYPGYYSQRFVPGCNNITLLAKKFYIDTSRHERQEFSVPLRTTQIQITHNGAIPNFDEGMGQIRYSTPWGEARADVDRHGRAKLWWFGQDPDVSFLANETSEWPNDLHSPYDWLPLAE